MLEYNDPIESFSFCCTILSPPTHAFIYASKMLIRGETIYLNIAILQYLLLQYNTIWPIENIDILHIAIYCNVLLDIVFFVAD